MSVKKNQALIKNLRINKKGFEKIHSSFIWTMYGVHFWTFRASRTEESEMLCFRVTPKVYAKLARFHDKPSHRAKIFLINNDLTVAEIARRIAPDWDATEESLRAMITDMINGRRFYPALAEKVFETVGLRLERPDYLKPLPSRRAA